MKILKVESTLPDGSKVVFDRESSKKEWEKIYKKFKKTIHGLKAPSSPKDFSGSLSNLNAIFDEMLTFIKKDKFLMEIIRTALSAILLKAMQDPSAISEWINQEQRNWTDPKILQERLKNIEKMKLKEE